MSDELADQVSSIGALAEPARRALYLYVASQQQAVGREQAANAVGVPLHSAKFHLDRLVEEDLLDVEFRRLSGRTGPGAGRPSKLYRRSTRQLSVSLPERHYDLVGDVLASAVERSADSGLPVAEAVGEAAAAHGRRLAAATWTSAPDAGALARTVEVLAQHGYQPRTASAEVRLANCPFDRLATEHTDLVCGLNLALIDGIIAGLDVPSVAAELAPEPGLCCVRLTERG